MHATANGDGSSEELMVQVGEIRDLWRPVETYFFNPIPIRTSSAVHRFLKSLQIEIRPEAGETAASG